LEALKFEDDYNCKEYSRWEDLKLKVVPFNVVQWVSIIYPLKKDFSIEIDLLHEKVKWWMNWS
jgi:hypothetical protein